MTTPKEFYQRTHEQLLPLAHSKGWTDVSLSPGPITASVNQHHVIATKLLLWLHQQMPPEATTDNLHAVLEAALWWSTFYASCIALPKDKPSENQAP